MCECVQGTVKVLVIKISLGNFQPLKLVGMFSLTHVSTHIPQICSRYHRYMAGFPFSCALNELCSTTPCNVVPRQSAEL